MDSKRILVTGSAGLVGQELVPALRAAGNTVVEFDLAHDPREDICTEAAVARAMQGCDGVFHLAAISRVAWGETAPDLCAAVNVAGTKVLLDAAKAAGAWFVFASSREIYGDPTVFPVTEKAQAAPVNHYGRSKAEGEVLVTAARAAGLRTAIIRLSSVYGTENDHPDRAIPALLWRAMAGEELQITGASNFFDFVHVDDCVRGLMLAADRAAAGDALPPVHLATGQATSLLALAEASLKLAGSKAKPTVLPPRAFDVSGFVGDTALAREVLGWEASIPLDEGLEELRDLFEDRGRPLDPVQMPEAGLITLTQ